MHTNAHESVKRCLKNLSHRGFGLPRFTSAWLAAALLAAQALACGPDFPNRILSGGIRALLAAPTAYFQREIERMQLVQSRYEYKKAPANSIDESADAELADMREALSQAGRTEQQSNDLVARHAVERQKLRAMAERSAPNPDIRIIEGLPAEFADYFRGSIEWHSGEMAASGEERSRSLEAARASWESLLRRPAEERRFKSTWAAFMLGKLELPAPEGDPQKAIACFQKVRALVDDGFMDSLGLAASSLGWEAQVQLRQGNLVRALELYLEQAATGDPTAAQSLRIVSAQALRPDNREELAKLARHSAARRVITLYLVRSASSDNQRQEAAGAGWLELLEAENVRDIDAAEQLALAAYQAGRMEIAKRWIERSAANSVVARWLRAKLLLYDGQLDEAAALLAKLSLEFPVRTEEGEKANIARNVVVASPEFSQSVGAAEHMLAELGVLRMERREFTQALDALLRSGFWLDAAYVAEQVLTLDELVDYVDAHWPPNPALAAAESPDYWQRVTEPDLIHVRIRYLLARRLARARQDQKARQYYPSNWMARYDELLELRNASRNEQAAPRERARDLFAAATITRRLGLELFGTEVAPDWHVYGGNFTVGITVENRVAIQESDLLKPSQEELARAMLHRPDPDRRFHYRYVAARLALEASRLLPDNDDETALILCTAGSWLKTRDPESADLFYKTLVRRCRKTAIGNEADRIRWFPNIDPKGNILPRMPAPQPAPREPEHVEPPLPVT